MIRTRTLSLLSPLLAFAFALAASASPALSADGPLRIIVFGAHPDDAELDAGGTAALWAKQGHKVKFVSVTNGDIGHHKQAGAILARRRAAEVQECAKILGITTDVLDIHDGELLPTLENRRAITRKIRDWKADIVISHRPNDYHPDHRYTAQLVQDAAFMVIVPSFCPDSPALRENPVFLYSEDSFRKPNPFEPEVVVPIDDVIDLKAKCYAALESQFMEWNPWLFSYENEVPEGAEARLEYASKKVAARQAGTANRFRAVLAEELGQEAAGKVRAAEAFELCEYGAQPSKEELRKMFPLPKQSP
jgi:LmbE family N-acetylglucosaminyl deacetylase